MSGWIEKLKAKETASKREKAEADRGALLKSRLIDANFPDFWERSVKAIEQDALALQRAFPDNEQYATRFERTADGFILTQLHGESKSIEARMHIEGQRVKCVLSEPGKNKTFDIELRATVNKEGSAYLVWGSQPLTQPTDVAKAFVMKVCGILD